MNFKSSLFEVKFSFFINKKAELIGNYPSMGEEQSNGFCVFNSKTVQKGCYI